MMLRRIHQECKLSEHMQLDALGSVITPSQVSDVLLCCGCVTPRERKLNLAATVWLVIAMNLCSHLSLQHVLEKMTHALGLLLPQAAEQLPSGSALTYRRYQLGVGPLRALFGRVCRPLATEATPGAFLFGLRLMALDGHVTNVPDTPENARCFGRTSSNRGESAWPQVQGVLLTECGTHAVVDAGFWPVRTSEQVGARRLLRSVGPGMLVMWDRGLHSFDLFQSASARGAHVLGRISSAVKPEKLRRLSDGSWLVRLRPSDKKRRKSGEQMVVRMIEYTLEDPHIPGAHQVHRLITTLLDPKRYPGHALACAYHLRWEEEATFDEIECHQQKNDTLLRSRKPVGVLQELYGLLLAHYAVRALIKEAAERSGVAPVDLSFTGALYLIGEAIHDFALCSIEEHPRLYEHLLRQIGRERLPPRSNRSNPRVVKRKMSTFDLKRPEHYNPPKPTRPFREAVVLI